jgi:hypothetical protein
MNTKKTVNSITKAMQDKHKNTEMQSAFIQMAASKLSKEQQDDGIDFKAEMAEKRAIENGTIQYED